MTRTRVERIVTRIPLVRTLVTGANRLLRRTSFASPKYWESRYAGGGTSGGGSYGRLALFKAEVLNAFVHEREVRSVIEFGCGDGAQLTLAEYPQYTGLDVAKTALALSTARLQGDETKSFFLYDPDCFVDNQGRFRAELALSLDVIFHLIEDRIFELYMRHLFGAAERFVIVYSSDAEDTSLAVHVKHRRFTEWVAAHLPEWALIERIPNRYPFTGDLQNSSFSDFFIYART